MKNNLLFSCLIFLGINLYGQDMEVAGQMKIKSLPADNSAQELVVKQSDGTLAKRTVASLISGSNAVDSVKSFQRDVELFKLLCQCENNKAIAPFMIDRLKAHGYTREDLVAAGFSEWDLDALDPVVDGDGNQYTPIRVGTEVWLLEPLKTTKYSDGTPIQYVPLAADWENVGQVDRTPAYCWPNGNPSNSDFGALYNFYAVEKGGICPYGYAPGTDIDIDSVEIKFGGVKEVGGAFWKEPNVSSNASKLSLRGAGIRDYLGAYSFFEEACYVFGGGSSIRTIGGASRPVQTYGFVESSNSDFTRYSSAVYLPDATGMTVKCKRLR